MSGRRNQVDWVDDAEERREKEIQEHARRQARKDKYSERKNGEETPTARPRAKTGPRN